MHGAARGISYLHDEVGQQHRVLHRDIKSANILLNKDWEAKVTDFGLSKIGPANMQNTFLITGAAGTFGYLDPLYYNTGVLTKESDVYSFGVVLFEILCGRLAFVEGSVFLGPLAERKYKENKLDEIIIPELRNQMRLNSLIAFSAIAYECLNSNRCERPKMGLVIEKLEKAYQIQASLRTAKIARVGIWGSKSNEIPENRWDFLLENDHKLKKITIDHGDKIYSLMFTSESKSVMYPSDTVGGRKGTDTVTEVSFDDDEELTGIDGTTGVYADAPFSVTWEKGGFCGFYGLAGYYIYGIGVYIKASSDEVIRVGKWGTKSSGRPHNQWSFQLERNHHLKKITIDHGYLIYSLIFTTEFRGQEQISDKAGGWNGGDIVSQVTFSWDEEIIAISGTVSVSKGTYAGFMIISSLAFITNKKTHVPYGSATGTLFIVPWDQGSFAGFYGLAGFYLDSIGVYLRDTI